MNGQWTHQWSVAIVCAAMIGSACTRPTEPRSGSGSHTMPDQTRQTVRRGDFIKTVRVHGTVEAVDFFSVLVPRLTGSGGNRLTLVRLAKKGTVVQPGDVLVEFDRQAQLKASLDARATLADLDEQVRRKGAEQAAARAQDETATVQAENAVARAKLEIVKNDLLPVIEAEKNTLALEAAQVRFAALRRVADMKRRAADADMRMLAIRRERAAAALEHAERNAERMLVRSPIAGMVVLKSVFKEGQMGEVQEGEEVWSGTAVLDVVGPRAMRVRAKINQADLADLRPGAPARVTLDAYPARSYAARLEQLAPAGAPGSFSDAVRSFVALFSVEGMSAELAPDLSAAVDIEVVRQAGVLLVPRWALDRRQGAYLLRVGAVGSRDVVPVDIGALNDTDAVVLGGAAEGQAVRR